MAHPVGRDGEAGQGSDGRRRGFPATHHRRGQTVRTNKVQTSKKVRLGSCGGGGGKRDGADAQFLPLVRQEGRIDADSKLK